MTDKNKPKSKDSAKKLDSTPRLDSKSTKPEYKPLTPKLSEEAHNFRGNASQERMPAKSTYVEPISSQGTKKQLYSKSNLEKSNSKKDKNLIGCLIAFVIFLLVSVICIIIKLISN